jgi:hypothetical protein
MIEYGRMRDSLHSRVGGPRIQMSLSKEGRRAGVKHISSLFWRAARGRSGSSALNCDDNGDGASPSGARGRGEEWNSKLTNLGRLGRDSDDCRSLTGGSNANLREENVEPALTMLDLVRLPFALLFAWSFMMKLGPVFELLFQALRVRS